MIFPSKASDFGCTGLGLSRQVVELTQCCGVVRDDEPDGNISGQRFESTHRAAAVVTKYGQNCQKAGNMFSFGVFAWVVQGTPREKNCHFHMIIYATDDI